jgi:hypothetical protein
MPWWTIGANGAQELVKLMELPELRRTGTEAESGTEETEEEVRADAASEILRLGSRREARTDSALG